MHTTDSTIGALLTATATIVATALQSRQNATDAEIGSLVETVAAALRKGASGPPDSYRID
jgi:hypothetical protein